MDFAMHPDAKPRNLIANTTQLHSAVDRPGIRGQETPEFLDKSHALSKGINMSRAAAFGLGAALAFVFGTSARAADLISQVPLQTPPSVAVPYDWTGAYFGGHVGYSRGSGRNTLFDPDPTAAGTSFGSLFGGFQLGYNYLLSSRLLVGIEGDISFPNFLDDGIVASRPSPTSTVTEKLDFVSTVRGRAGYAFDHWLFYATGGFPLTYPKNLELLQIVSPVFLGYLGAATHFIFIAPPPKVRVKNEFLGFLVIGPIIKGLRGIEWVNLRA
jgi:hypothetical protein